jgi:uncharacterized membrane protein YdjX (TVP38/TMEM64 family)
VPALPPRWRLVLLAVALLAAFLTFWVFGALSQEEVRNWIEPLGALGPPAYVAIAVVLGAAMVPGPLLAGVSGLLFGTALGTLVTITAAIGSAVVALLLGRTAGARPAEEIAGPRTAALTAQLRRHGTLAVAVQRLIPGVPDAPCSYAAGVAGLKVWQIALGTLIGSSPRAFSYTAIGDSFDDPGAVTVVAVVVLVLAGAAGTLLAGRAWVRRPGR